MTVRYKNNHQRRDHVNAQCMALMKRYMTQIEKMFELMLSVNKIEEGEQDGALGSDAQNTRCCRQADEPNTD